MTDHFHPETGALWLSGSDLEDVWLHEDWTVEIERTELGRAWEARRNPPAPAQHRVWPWAAGAAACGVAAGVAARFF